MELCKSFYTGSNPVLASTQLRSSLMVKHWIHKPKSDSSILSYATNGVWSIKVMRRFVEPDKTVRYRPYTPKENCPSGRWGRFAKPLYDENCTVGSNPTFSAKMIWKYEKFFVYLYSFIETRSVRLRVRSHPFHGCNTGSNPVPSTKKCSSSSLNRVL